jgi:PAS domain S-box-containing protein
MIPTGDCASQTPFAKNMEKNACGHFPGGRKDGKRLRPGVIANSKSVQENRLRERGAMLRGYAVCFGTVAGATLVAAFFSHVAGRPSHVFAPFFLAVLVTALYGGREAGLVSVGLSVLSGVLLLKSVVPEGVLHIDDALALSVFAVVGVSFVFICQRMRSALDAAKEAGRSARESEQRMRLVADGLPALIAYIDKDRRYRFVSQTYERWFGIKREQMLGRRHDEMAPNKDAYDQQVRSQVDSALAGKVVTFQARLPYPDGVTRDVEAIYCPDVGSDGQVNGFASLVLDVSGPRRVEEKLRFLADADRVLASSLDYEVTLGSLAKLAVPVLGDWCIVDIADDAGQLRRVAVTHCDPDKQPFADELRQHYPARAHANQGALHVYQTGQSELYRQVDDNEVRQSCVDEANFRLLKALGIGSAMVVPLSARGSTVGAISFVSGTRELTTEDLETAQELAARAALSVENAQLYHAVRESEERFRIVQELSPSGFAIMRAVRSTLDGAIVDFLVEYINPAGVRMGKYGLQNNVVGKALSEVSPGSMKEPRLFPMYCRAVETGRPEQIELRFESERAVGWFHVQSVPMGGERLAVSYSDVTSQRELLTRERTARSEAERASRLKDEFLATLSHELRTPLNAILGWAQLLNPGNSDREDLQIGIATIERNARVQKQIIEDLLDMSRIIAGKIRIEVQRVDPVMIVDAAIESVRPAAEAKNIRFAKALDPTAGQVNADGGRLQQIVWNLLTNAIKFTPRGGEVRVSLGRADDQLRIAVSDDGQGIKPEFLPHIFERFRQQDASTTRKHGGLGLGLSIVKQLVELHGGTVHAESDGEGRGARFVVDLPLADVPPETSGRLRSTDRADGSDEPVSLAGLKLLVVDDEPDARELVGRILRECGAEVLSACSANEAMQLLPQHRPDVILSDIGMPERDGYDLIQEIRSLPYERGGRTPAIALTALARSEDRIRALRAGYQIHISKPVERRELIATVASFAGFSAREAKSGEQALTES